MKHGLILSVAALVAFTSVCCAAANSPTLAPGATAPDFSLTNVDGRVVSLRDFASAKVLVVVFTCTHCPSAQLAEEPLKKIVNDYKARGVSVVAISSSSPKGARLDEFAWTDLDDSFESMKLRAKDRNFNFPYLYDGEEPQAVSHAYGTVATPHFFIFDAERKLRYQGRLRDDERHETGKGNYVRDAIDALLAGKEPPVAQTKVVGCSTKWATKWPQVQAYNERCAAEPVSVEKVDEAGMKALRKNESGKLRLVKFWTTTCAPCIVEFPEFVTMNHMYRSRPFELVTVCLNKPDDGKSVLALLEKKHASCRNLLFGSADTDKLINAFEPEWQGEVPYIVLIAPDGKIVYRQSGSIDPLELRRAIVKNLDAIKSW